MIAVVKKAATNNIAIADSKINIYKWYWWRSSHVKCERRQGI